VKVRIDGGVCKQIAEKVMSTILTEIFVNEGTIDFAETINQWIVELNIIPFIEGFVRCAAMMRTVFSTVEEILIDPKAVIVIQEDLDKAEVYAMRLFKDTFSVYHNAIIESANTSGIQRINTGVVR
jgi:hypothetical protein